MAAYTIFERGFPSRPAMRVASSPFLRNLAPRNSGTGNTQLQRQPSFDRYITVGNQLSPDTGAVIGRGVIPLPNILGTNESISVYGDSGSGKCLDGNMKLRLEDGTFISIKDFYDKYNQLHNKNYKILSLNPDLKPEYNTIVSISKRELRDNEPLLKIKTRGNHTLSVTGNHKVFVWNNGIIEKSASDIVLGDYLISISNNFVIDNIDLYNDYEISMLACLIADGHLRKHQFIFTKGNAELLTEFLECSKKYGFKDYWIKTHQNHKNIIVNSGIGKGKSKNGSLDYLSQVKQFYDIFGIKEGLDATSKYIPEGIFRTSKRQKSIFLNRLISCDGYVGKQEIEYSSNSNEIIKGIVQLLLDFGIDSKVGEGDKHAVVNGIRGRACHSYRLSVEGINNLKRFNDQIGLIHSEKSARLLKIISSDKKNGNSMDSLLPNIEKWLKELRNHMKPLKRQDHHMKKMVVYRQYLSKKLNPTKHGVKSLLKFVKSLRPNTENTDIFKYLTMLSDLDLIFYEVKSIEQVDIKEKKDVYDLEIEDNHNLFVGNTAPFLVHNSVVMRSLIEHYSINEHRCVIIFDPTKNQYWSFNQPQNRPEMVRVLEENGIHPTKIQDIEVYVPIYDAVTVGMRSIETDYHSDKEHLISIRMSGLTAKGFFELGDIDPGGRMYQGFMESALNLPRQEKTVMYLTNYLNMLMMDKSKTRSVASLKNIFEPLVQQNIISDNGTDVKRMLHHPRTDGSPGKISVISMGTSEPNDRRRNALVSSIVQQLYDAVRDDISIKPVIVIDESKEFIGDSRDVSPATIASFGRLHLQGRAWGRVMIYGYQDPNDVSKFFGGRKGSPINILMSKSLTLADGKTKLMGTGYGHVYINGTGDPKVPDMDFLIKTFPCRTRHID